MDMDTYTQQSANHGQLRRESVKLRLADLWLVFYASLIGADFVRLE